MSALDQAFPTVSAEAWERGAATATTHGPGPNTLTTPAQRSQASTARRANRRWPRAAVIATAGGALAALATAAAILLAPTAAAKSGEYGQNCTGPHNVTAATCGALQQVPLAGATPEGCHRTGPVSTACGRASRHRDPSDASSATLPLSGGATLAVSGGADSTITSAQSGNRPNLASTYRFSPTRTPALHATSHR
jgi:hypothetical protein